MTGIFQIQHGDNYNAYALYKNGSRISWISKETYDQYKDNETYDEKCDKEPN